MGVCASQPDSSGGRSAGSPASSPTRSRTAAGEATTLSPPGATVVQIIGITDVPWMDLLSPSDCFVRLDVIDGTTGRRYDCCARTLTLEDTIAPTWGRAFLALPLRSDPAAGDLVRIQIWDEDLPKRAEFADDLIAEGTLPLSALADGDTHTFTLTMLTKQMRGLPAGATASTATLRLVTPTASPAQASADALSAPSAPLAPPFGGGRCGGGVVKTLFLIRHGESVWNEGEQTGKLEKMAGFDHPLSSEGIAQALRFNAKWHAGGDKGRTEDSDCDAFFSSPTILVSPLTRALQTCLITLSGHPTLVAKGATLTASMREVKNRVTSLDTVGIAVGVPAIKKRAIAEMESEGAHMEMDSPTDADDDTTKGRLASQWSRVLHASNAVTLEGNDAVGPGPWWTPKSEADAGSEALDHRMSDWFSTIRFTDTANVVCVGHSLFFREVLRRCIPAELMEAESERVALFKKTKMANAGCIRVQLYFPPIDTTIDTTETPSPDVATATKSHRPSLVQELSTKITGKTATELYEAPLPSALSIATCFGPALKGIDEEFGIALTPAAASKLGACARLFSTKFPLLTEPILGSKAPTHVLPPVPPPTGAAAADVVSLPKANTKEIETQASAAASKVASDPAASVSTPPAVDAVAAGTTPEPTALDVSASGVTDAEAAPAGDV